MNYSNSSPIRRYLTSKGISKAIALSVGVIAMVFLMSVVVWAWTEPSQPPPQGNVPAPINIGTTAQTKAGTLILEQKLEFKETDSDHVWFYEGTPDNDNKVDLRIMLTDDRSDNEKFSIWDRYWRDGSIREDHYFTAAGNAWHRGNLSVGGHLTAGGLTVQDNFTASIGCADFLIGYSGRRGSPGRALVDLGNDLRLNYGGDWSKASIGSSLDIYGDITSVGNICLDDGCRSNWPSVSESDTLDSVSDRGRATDQILRFPKFEDYDNTGYYVDPNSWSKLLYLESDRWRPIGTNDGRIIRVGGQIRYDADDNWYWYSIWDNHNEMTLHYRNGLWLRSNVDADDLIARDRICIRGDCKTSWPSLTESDTLDSVSDRGRVTNQVLRFPKFEDYDNTGYYVDPASTNRMNYVYANRLRADSINLDGDELRFYRSTDSIIRKTDAYLELHGSANGNSRMWLEDGADRIYIGDGNTDLRLRGTVREVDDLYAYRMFDRNNTGYYIDPASVSRLYAADFTNSVSIGRNYGLLLGGHGSGESITSPSSGGASLGIKFRTANSDRMVIENGGNVGIGITSPGAKLTVSYDGTGPCCESGNDYLLAIATTRSHNEGEGSGTTHKKAAIMFHNGWQSEGLFGLYNKGGRHSFFMDSVQSAVDLYISGDYHCHGTDVAEKTQGVEPLFPGEVVSLDEEKEGKLRRSRGTYEREVAGVVSTNPGLVLGDSVEIVEIEGVNLALAGRVPVRVTTENGPISVGDPLVTSSKSGYAMRGDEDKVSQMFGVVLGKAMERLEEGEGEILVLIALR